MFTGWVFPRTDLHVSVAGVEIKPVLALGSWAAFAGNDSDAMVMGDLVLLENELTSVMKKLRAAGFDITAVHNHVLNEAPHVIYMHYMGYGKAVELAKSLHSALAESKKPPPGTRVATWYAKKLGIPVAMVNKVSRSYKPPPNDERVVHYMF